MRFDREIYFDHVRNGPFDGSLTQQQVDGQNAILLAWEVVAPTADLRWLAYMLATAYHETAATMWPIEEFNKGQGQPYGVPDPETKQVYYGRGLVQLTWRDNYARATEELGLHDDYNLEWHADRALDPITAARVMFRGMYAGWFRPPNDLPLFFDDNTNDAFGARDIINGDKNTVPDWSGGKSIGRLIADYHGHFHDALTAASKGD